MKAGEAGEIFADLNSRRVGESCHQGVTEIGVLAGIVVFRPGLPFAPSLAMKRPCRFQDLIAWQLAVQLRQLAHAFCEKPAIRSNLRFRNNLSEAASSAPRNIAEGFGRKYHREFARFAIIARGSVQEVLDGFIEAHERGYIDAAEFDRADHAARKTLKVLNGLIAYLESTPDWGRD